MKKPNKKQLKFNFSGENRPRALLSLMVRSFFYCLNHFLNTDRISFGGRKTTKTI